MGLLTSIITNHPFRAAYAPWDDFWFTKKPFGAATQAGYPLTPEGAMRLSAVYACVGLIADMIGSLPLILYRRMDNDGKERATSNPLYKLLRRQPNDRQTAKEWRTMGAAHLLLRGNFYNEIIFDGRGSVAQLLPLHPDRVRVNLLDSGRRGYIYRAPGGADRNFTQDEIFHVLGLSLDGITGCSVIEHAREGVAAALAQDAFAATFWRQGAEGHLAFVAPNAMSEEVRKANEKALQERLGGWEQAHKAILLEGGLKPERISVSGRDSQYIESRRFSVSDIARFFRVPPHMIGDVERSTSWGTGIEEMTIAFVNFTILPWLVSFEQAIDRDLILDERHFAEFLVDALLRGNMAARSTAYSIYVQNGIMSENEVRIRENMNPYPGLDVPRRAVNQAGSGAPAPPSGTPPSQRPAVPPSQGVDDQQGAAWPIILDAAAQTVRKETSALRKWHPRLSTDAATWCLWVANFYGRHVDELTRRLGLDVATARRYGADHCGAVLASGLAVLDDWEAHAPAALAALALGRPIHSEEVRS